MQRLSGFHRHGSFWLLCAIVLLASAIFSLLITNRTVVAPYVSTTRYHMAEPSLQAHATTPPFAFPAGGQTLLPQHRFVALYGSPGIPQLGVLGEFGIDQAMERAKALAAEYQPFSKEKIYPTVEIIASVASASPTENGDYSREIEVGVLQPWVDAARQAGVYVLLDLQPGRSSFLDQVRQYESLLREPHVGLALDPEWRLKPDEVHLAQIGSVGIDEVNATSAWLASLTAHHQLPQKLFLVHQFRTSMLPDRNRLDTNHRELGYVIQMDGHGPQLIKHDTWDAIRQDAPQHVYFGWKQFYDEDQPMATPEEVMHIDPQPWYISYQ